MTQMSPSLARPSCRLVAIADRQRSHVLADLVVAFAPAAILALAIAAL